MNDEYLLNDELEIDAQLIEKYENDIAAGRLIRLPCVVGDRVTYTKNDQTITGTVQDITWRGEKYSYGQQFWINVDSTSIFERDIIKVTRRN